MTPDPGDRTAALPTPAAQEPAAHDPGPSGRAGRAQLRLAGRYRLLELVGRGGSAEVWAAEDEALGRRVAVKLVTATGGEDAGRVGDEARLLARLSHPGLVPVYDAGTDDAGRPFVVMELVPGETLSDAVGRGPMDPERVAPIGRVLAEALAYVHGEGLVHRDVKPANVLLGRDGRVRLTDFGIARLVDAAKVTATGLTVGTASYLSPEQVRGAAVGPLSDVYSLGLVLLECLRGEREYPGTTVEVAVARLHRSPVVPDGLPQGWPGLLRADDRAGPRRPADGLRGRARPRGRRRRGRGHHRRAARPGRGAHLGAAPHAGRAGAPSPPGAPRERRAAPAAAQQRRVAVGGGARRRRAARRGRLPRVRPHVRRHGAHPRTGQPLAARPAAGRPAAAAGRGLAGRRRRGPVVRRARLLGAAAAAALLLSGCASSPEADLNSALSDLTDAANARSAARVRTTADDLIAVVNRQSGSSLPLERAASIRALAERVKADAALLEVAPPPTPTPSQSPSPTPTPPKRTPTPTPSASPTPTPTRSATPSPTPSSASPTPTASPSTTGTALGSPSPTPTSSPTTPLAGGPLG